ncbi:MAG TPA: hypothetical protein VNX65_03635, partial [Patescibacteria group bacterium]|nr:hypothetical protein [Patescibacteria group bacterium]
MPDTKLRPDAKTPAHNPSNANFEKIIADNYGDPHAEKLRQQAMAEASAAEAAEQIAKEASTAQPNTLEGSGSVPTQSSIPTSFNKSGKGKAKTPGKSSTKKWIIGGILSVLGLGGGFSVYSAISGMFNIPHFGFGGSNYSKHQSSFLAKRQEKLQARIYDPKYGIKAGEIAAMQEEGILPKDPIKFAAAVGTGPNGDPYVRHLIGPDGQLIDKAGFAKALADPKMAGWADSVTGGFSRLASWRARGPTTLRLLIGKWKIPLDYFFGSKDVSDTKTLKQKLYEKLFGEKAKPLLGDVGNNANSEADAARAKAVADGTVPELPVDNPIDGLSPTQIAVRLNASKLMGILGAALGSGCYVASEFRKAEFGIWLLKHQEMIAYAEAFFNVLNAAQAGGGNAAQLGLLLGLLFIPGKNGKSFVQSNYVQHFIFGGGINADKDLAKVALTEPGSGSKTWGTVRTFLKPFNSKLACSNVSQGVVFGATIIATFFTGGVAAILKMMALSLPMVLAMSMLDSVIQPYLVRALLGAVPGLTDGGKLAGEAMFVGATALTEQTGWTNGLHPLSKLLAYESELAVAPEMNRMTAAEHLKTSPFSIDSPDSISNRLAWSVLPYAA